MEVSINGDIMVRKHSDGNKDILHLPVIPDKKAQRREAILNLFDKLKGGVQTVYAHTYDEYITYEITPTTSVRNNQAYLIAKVVSSFYRTPAERRKWGTPWKDSLLQEASQYRINLRIVMKPNDIAFYLLLPREKAGEILRKAEAIYDSGITIKEVPSLDPLDHERMFCTELKYRRHDIFSISTDKDNNYPLPSILSATRTLEGEDVAIFDAMLEPYSRLEWHKEAKAGHKMLENGQIPDNSAAGKLLRLVNDVFSKVRMSVLEMTRFTAEQKKELKRWEREKGTFLEAELLREGMQPATKRKQDSDVLKVHLRIAVQSDDPARAKDAAYTLSNAWKDLSSDNELERVDVPTKWNKQYWQAIEDRKGFYVSFKPPKMSVDEAGKLLQLPGKELITEYPQIRNKSMKEVALPAELCIEGIRSVRIGHVTERGQRKMARIPLEAYSFEGASGKEIKVSLKAAYDAVCTGSFAQGKQGSGKSEGYGAVTAYDFVMAGFTVIVTDTADGEVLRNLVNSLPADFPDEKIHALNLDNKAYPMPLDWADIYGRTFTATGVDDELQALEISERLTQRLIGFINSLKATGEEFSDRMQQYVISCMRAITTRSTWSFLDLELALTSPAYRDELLLLESVQSQPDVVRDLKTLQDRAMEGKDRAIVDPIMARLKELSSTQFMTNLFYQSPKLNDDGTPVLNLRRIMDNPEGGYGHVVVVQASFDAWQEAQATLLGFMEDKVNFNAYSRIDIPQADRKPVLKWLDEPHKIIKAVEDRISETSVEFRKYRIKSLFTNHSIDQMGAATNALLDGGAQITSYKTERPSELKRFAHVFQPYDDYKELYNSLPDKHVAINKVRLGSGQDCPAFIADMVAPPAHVKDRSKVWNDCAVRYGRPWKEVRDTIKERRSNYLQLDESWVADKKEAVKAMKAAEKEAKKPSK